MNGRSGISSRHIAEDKELFLPLEALTNARNVRFSIHFSTQKKGLFHACVKKNKLLYNIILVHYDTCDLSSTFLHGVKLEPERSEGPNNAVQSAP